MIALHNTHYDQVVSARRLSAPFVTPLAVFAVDVINIANQIAIDIYIYTNGEGGFVPIAGEEYIPLVEEYWFIYTAAGRRPRPVGFIGWRPRMRRYSPDAIWLD